MIRTKILIDNGHGSDTPGKCSPDGKYKEYAYNRRLAVQLENELLRLGYDAERIVPEDTDISLATRCKRVNIWCDKLGKDNVILLSIHTNAAGTIGWSTAQGWSAYTTKGITGSDDYAEYLYKAADKYLSDRKIRTYSWQVKGRDWEEDFYILKHTKCVAVLTENFFHTSKSDLAFMLSDDGFKRIVDTLLFGTINYLNTRYHGEV